jgi:ADP-ribose pyrophosphatase YjhB (NUDIX family)
VSYPRAKAFAIARRGDAVLLWRGYDELKDAYFWRPAGGHIELGEHSRDAVLREMREELGSEVVEARFLATIESIFESGGEVGHEIVLLYEVDLADRHLYEVESFTGVELDGAPLDMHWRTLAELEQDGLPVYPDGLFAFLEQHLGKEEGPPRGEAR